MKSRFSHANIIPYPTKFDSLGFAKSLSLKVSSFYHFYNSIEFCYDTPQGGPYVNKNSLFSD